VNEQTTGALQDVLVTFEDIRRMEEKRMTFNAEADAILSATIREWDNLFDALMMLGKTYQKSDALLNSKMHELYRGYKMTLDQGTAAEPTNYERRDE
jgi:hypothetical protein